MRPAILVTGANGFVGTALCNELASRGNAFLAASRSESMFDAASATRLQISQFDADTDWSRALAAGGTVVHLAARVHVLRDDDQRIEDLYYATNVAATLNLANQAAAAGVKRFIFASSIKVNGEGRETAFTELDQPSPKDHYGRSKLLAEIGLRDIASSSGMEVVILRLPLVYGPGVKANFLRLMSLVDQGVPLPFAGIHNKRSMIFLGNVADAFLACMNSPNAANQTFLLSDGEDVSTSDLVRQLAAEFGRPVRLFRVPEPAIVLLGKLVGRSAEIDRLFGSMCVDSSLIRQSLGWRPPFSLKEGLAWTAEWYLGQQLNSHPQ